VDDAGNHVDRIGAGCLRAGVYYTTGAATDTEAAMDIINLLVQLLSGAIGGNVAGNLSRTGGLGAPANTLSGAVGGGIGGQILSALLGLAAARAANGALDIPGFISQLLAGGLSGGVLTALLTLIRAASAR
jgi:hypothetical protein